MCVPSFMLSCLSDCTLFQMEMSALYHKMYAEWKESEGHNHATDFHKFSQAQCTTSSSFRSST